MLIAGYILIILGGIIFAYWWVHLLGLAYRCGGGWFLGCLFVPIIWIVFVLLNLRTAAKPCGRA